ncbi:hypothetical protein LCGC14_2449260 [marine sediment metagenome]|uniref:Uncharacterized protein n=1 Tax=marine sediment metagenome TaxID=412755 RepID=A0A0F9C471_9ZZZZ
MFDKIFNLYKIGEGLGLSRKEINKVFLFDNSKHSLLYKILLIIVISFLGFLIVLVGIEISTHIYPAGTLYSTVRVNDFKKKIKTKRIFKIFN